MLPWGSSTRLGSKPKTPPHAAPTSGVCKEHRSAFAVFNAHMSPKPKINILHGVLFEEEA
ncbi:MAG: hypothetical protein B7Z37_12490 [Verrucomicrobia bacterium 12-59-8]|nr:MAG: hypothetical protein B7Z37_12490 [Verrucomicrobia bacterium 12-59-8]